MKKVLVVGLVALYVVISFWNIDRFPKIHFDEIGIVAPGYKFFSEGIFGSDLYKGLYNQHNIYLETMPLMSLMTGATTHLLGVGIKQMRVVPIVAGALTLTLTFLSARFWAKHLKRGEHENISPDLFGILCMGLNLFWQWAPAGASDFIGSGIPLIDVSRLARYDILVPVFGMGAFLSWMRARQNNTLFYDILGGILAGLATLSNIYGIFWGFALMLLFFLDHQLFNKEPIWRCVVVFSAGMIFTIGIWVVVILFNWQDFIGQIIKHQGRYDFFDPDFYLESMLREIHRYHLGLRKATTYARTGLWLLIIGIPTTFLHLTHKVIRERFRQGLWLIIPCFLFPLLFALLVNVKRYYYLMTIAPLFCILLGWGAVQLLQSHRLYLRSIVWFAMAFSFAQGFLGIIHLHKTAAHEDTPTEFFAQLREVVPPAQHVLGPQLFWPALYQEEYQATPLLFIITNPIRPDSISFIEALYLVSPEIVLVDTNLISWLETAPFYIDPIEEIFWSYMEQQNARLIGELWDNEGRRVQIYHLKQE